MGKERLLRILEWYRLKDRHVDHYSLAIDNYSLVTNHYSLATNHYFTGDKSLFHWRQITIHQHAWIASRQIKIVHTNIDKYREMFKSYYCLLACIKKDLIDSRDLKDSQTDTDRLLLISTNFHTTDRLTWAKFTYLGYFTMVHFTYKRDGLRRQKTSF